MIEPIAVLYCILSHLRSDQQILQAPNSDRLLFSEKSNIFVRRAADIACWGAITLDHMTKHGRMIMYRKTTILVTALIFGSSAIVGAFTSATPALARAHRQHHASPAQAYDPATFVRDHGSNAIPFAPF